MTNKSSPWRQNKEINLSLAEISSGRQRWRGCQPSSLFSTTSPLSDGAMPECRLFKKFACKGTWRQVFICLWALSPHRFLFGVVKQFFRFWVWSNTCINPVYAVHTTRSLSPSLWMHTKWGRGGAMNQRINFVDQLSFFWYFNKATASTGLDDLYVQFALKKTKFN